ncbi:hypothetical protein Avbf_17803 [Armadillidium vulgare]|nr:hypothetical protein Avbf_17803 [Armadillidium vulgare]
MSFVIALTASGSLFVSVIMPWHHILIKRFYFMTTEKYSQQETMNKLPIKNSVFSISNFSSYFWFILSAIAIRSYTLWFNPWISRISETSDEVAFYTLIFSIGAYLSPIVTPLPGILNDKLIQKIMSTYPNKKKRLEKELKIPLFTLVMMILVLMVIFVCLLFNNQVAIYVSIVLVQIARPLFVSVSSSFYRIRFPPEHFERLQGFLGITPYFSCSFAIILSSSGVKKAKLRQ